MTKSFILVFFFVVVFFAVATQPYSMGLGHRLQDANNIDCGKECGRRCSLSSRPKVCVRGCTMCCARCNCVPPGTSGNENICPCYADMTAHGGRKKCP
ncbi:gibberellin-regulated protein 11-like [Andrographis paniculata]|uniref:gibberellin-regulated protein 11-like n=1 Tax=Andrographis paniculata TaxID=175694 RepID=UPI0021E7C215|nr:gibberellin-regulated protein 11-like [Andrographis paniculata]